MTGVLVSALVIYALIHIIFIQPKQDQARSNLIFENRVLSFVEGLFFLESDFGCSIYDIRIYTKQQLQKLHTIPGNQHLIEYTSSRGFKYSSSTGEKDYALFAVLCMAQYSSDYNIPKLNAWCEANLELARKHSFYA